MTADVELLPCGECGMPCRPGEYHPYAACLMFKACHNSETVRGNLQDAQDHATAAKDAEVEALRAEVERVTCELMDAITRADKLAEALRDAADDIDAGVPPEDAAAHLRARADLLRDQEESHEQ